MIFFLHKNFLFLKIFETQQSIAKDRNRTQRGPKIKFEENQQRCQEAEYKFGRKEEYYIVILFNIFIWIIY